MKVDFKIVCIVLLAFCFVAESEGWWSRRSSRSSSSSSSRSSSSSSRSSSSSSSSRRSSSQRRGWSFRRPRRPSPRRFRLWPFGRKPTASPQAKPTRGYSKIRLPPCSLRFGTPCIWSKQVTTKRPSGPTKTPAWCSTLYGFCIETGKSKARTSKAPVKISPPASPFKSSGSSSENSCPLPNKVKRRIPKNIPGTFHHCLEATPQQCCTYISGTPGTITVVLHVIDNWPKYLAIAPTKLQVAVITIAGVNFLHKTIKWLGTQVHHISGEIKKKVTKIDLVERPLAFALAILLKYRPECSSYVIRCLQKSHMWTTLRNQPGNATHSAALLYTEDDAMYLIEKGGTLGTRNDRRQIRRVFFLTSKWNTEKTITPAKRRTVQEYYRKMGGGYNLYDDNCHDGTKAVERLAESSD
ncbi:Hypothetical predicted protein [Paramuricea clavata]|uniref:Uncharacterized protein n=1 Tax=Paramuricea clavata TaxID=317549 RepID=A0A6S7HNA8_PARCT|nr:Hypothetical predicted protein [Paramuricea clavata]